MGEKSFKEKYTLKDRLAEATRIREKYPERVPIIVERYNNNDDIPNIDKHKYLVPVDITVGKFIYIIRKRIKLPPEKAMFVFVNNTIPSTSMTIGTIYDIEQEADNFLYFFYSSEATFGDGFI